MRFQQRAQEQGTSPGPYAMGIARFGTIVLAGYVSACTTLRASYPSWEPTSATVPIAKDPKLALADLEVSRKLWLDRKWQDYSYVRARQTSPDRVEFTLIVVRRGTVSERSLMTSPTDESGLGDRLSGKLGQTPQLLWREHGREIGRHETGAPALTMDQLYGLCRERVLSVQSETSPRLSFHRDGLLQHCGFLGDDCDDCATASVQTVPNNLADPRPVPVPDSEQQADRDNICKIDPVSCRTRQQPERASWFCKHLYDADGCGGGIRRDLTPECLALPRPTSWSDPAWQGRCGPRR